MATHEEPTPTEEAISGSHPWAENVNRFPSDQRLRLHGFVLTDRPNKGPALWKRNGKQYTEEEARAEVVRDLEALRTRK